MMIIFIINHIVNLFQVELNNFKTHFYEQTSILLNNAEFMIERFNHIRSILQSFVYLKFGKDR